MTRREKWRIVWLAWIAAFVTLDILAGSDSLSRTLGRLFPKPVRRVLLVGLMILLTLHISTQPQMKPQEACCAAIE